MLSEKLHGGKQTERGRVGRNIQKQDEEEISRQKAKHPNLRAGSRRQAIKSLR